MRRSVCMWQKFRESFSYPSKDLTHFYPSHMAKGMVQMQHRLRDVDLVVEVHDARMPLTGRNPHFRETITVRPHLLILNKMDLADSRYFQRVSKKLKDEYGVQHLLYTNCKRDHHNTVKKKLMPQILEIIRSNPRYHRDKVESYNVMVIGIPNVGKSSLINALRRIFMHKGKATAVGPHAGVTRSVMEKIRVCDEPLTYIYDCPGIMMPEVKHMQVAMKLALCATLKDSVVMEENITDYLLYWLNKHQYFQYVDYYNLPAPTDNILELLGHVAKQFNAVQKQRSVEGGYVQRPNYNLAAKKVLLAWREGNLGRYNLDEDFFNENAEVS